MRIALGPGRTPCQKDVIYPRSATALCQPNYMFVTFQIEELHVPNCGPLETVAV